MGIEINTDSISGVLYDENGNKLSTWDGITTIEPETLIEPIEQENYTKMKHGEVYYSSMANISFSGETIYTYPSYAFTEAIVYKILLTKRQNHLRKYGKSRVRKKYKNKVLRILKRKYARNGCLVFI